MHIKKIIIILLCDFYFFQCSQVNLKNNFQLETKNKPLLCPVLNHQETLNDDEEDRINVLRDKVESTQGKSQNLYLEALTFEVNGNKDKADRAAFQAYLASQPHAYLLKDKNSLSFALNSLLNVSFLDQEIKEMIKKEILFEVQRDIKRLLLKVQDNEVESKQQYSEMYNSVQDIYNNCLALIEDNLDKKDKAIFFNSLKTVKSFLDNSRMQETVRLLLLQYKDEKELIITKHEEGLDFYFKEFNKRKRQIIETAFDLLPTLFSQCEKEKDKRAILVSTEFAERNNIYQSMMKENLSIINGDFESSLNVLIKKFKELKEMNRFNKFKDSFLDKFLTFDSVAREEFYEKLYSFSYDFFHKKVISSVRVQEEDSLFNKILSVAADLKKEKTTNKRTIGGRNNFTGISFLVFDGEHQKERGFLLISSLEQQGVDFSKLETSDLSYNRIILKILTFHVSSSQYVSCIILPKDNKVYFEVVSIFSQSSENSNFQQSQNLSLSGSLKKELSDLTTPPPLPTFKKLYT